MRKLDNHIFQGLQMDASVSKQQPQFLCDAHNIRILTRGENTSLSLTNEKGTKEAPISFLGGGTSLKGICLGYCTLNEYAVLFTTYQTTVSGSPYLRDYIWLLDFSNINNIKATKLFEGNLNFQKDHPIKAWGVYEGDFVQKVYWTDGYNQPRVINIKRYSQASTSSSSKAPLETAFDFVPTLELKDSIEVHKVSDASSLFGAGVIQYAISYYNKYGQESNISNVTTLYSTSFNNRAGSPEERVPTAFRVVINNPDLSFEYLRLYSIFRSSQNGTPYCKRVADVALGSSKKVVITDNNTLGEVIDNTELLYVGGESIAAGTLEQKDGTMFFGDVQITRPNIPLGFSISNNVSSKSNSTRKFYVDCAISNDYYKWGNTLNAFKISNNSKVLQNAAAFKYGQYYRLGLQFQYKTGRWSEPVYLGEDVRITNHPSVGAYSGDDTGGDTYTNATSVTITGINTAEVGGGVQLTATVNPSDASGYTVKWSSSDTSVATVTQSGRVTAVGEGTATITCTITNADGSTVTDSYEFTVTAASGGETTGDIWWEIDGETVSDGMVYALNPHGGTFTLSIHNSTGTALGILNQIDATLDPDVSSPRSWKYGDYTVTVTYGANTSGEDNTGSSIFYMKIATDNYDLELPPAISFTQKAVTTSDYTIEIRDVDTGFAVSSCTLDSNGTATYEVFVNDVNAGDGNFDVTATVRNEAVAQLQYDSVSGLLYISGTGAGVTTVTVECEGEQATLKVTVTEADAGYTIAVSPISYGFSAAGGSVEVTVTSNGTPVMDASKSSPATATALTKVTDGVWKTTVTMPANNSSSALARVTPITFTVQEDATVVGSFGITQDASSSAAFYIFVEDGPSDGVLEIGETATLLACLSTSHGVDAQWSISNSSVASISATEGAEIVVTALKAGTATITAHVDGYVDATYDVTVKKAPESIELLDEDTGKEVSSYSLKAGGAGVCEVYVNGVNASTGDFADSVSVSSSDTSVAEGVYFDNNGKLTVVAKSAGTCEITVSCGSLTATLDVTVSGTAYRVTINPSPSDATVKIDGVTISQVDVPEGTVVSYEVSKDGYVTKTGSVTVTKDETITVTLEEETVTEDITVEVSNGANYPVKVSVDSQDGLGNNVTLTVRSSSTETSTLTVDRGSTNPLSASVVWPTGTTALGTMQVEFLGDASYTNINPSDGLLDEEGGYTVIATIARGIRLSGGRIYISIEQNS